MVWRRRGGIGVVLALGLGAWGVVGAGGASACQSCSSELTCVQTSRGAIMCFADGIVCMLGGRCSGIGIFEPPGTIESVQVTLLDDSPGLASAGPMARVASPDGVAVGRRAARLAARAAGGAAEPSVVFSLAGAMESGTAVFRSPSGDGFTLSRERAGRGARLVVSALDSGRPGRTLADERVREDEALLVRVPFQGRTCVLVLQAATLSEAEARVRDPEVRRELQSAQAGRPQQMRPPFELGVLDR